MEKRILVIHIPVIHKGYLDFLSKIKNKISGVFVIDGKFISELSEFKVDIASIESKKVIDLLKKFGFKNIFILTKSSVKKLINKKIVLINDEVSRNLAGKYLVGNEIEWDSVFLRWDREKVLRQENLVDIVVSRDGFDIEMMQEALKESEKSGDWWRQIGAVLVKDKEIILRANNKDLPSDHTPYQVGEARDFFKAGQSHEIANTIHAEQYIIAKAAKDGISVNNLAIYVTTFPCPVCAKMIACSGVKQVFFAEGGSNFDAKKVLESAGVKLVNVPIK
jgi:dCMP deaminase